MRIATATLSKGLLLFRRLLGEKIGLESKRMSPRSSSSLPEQYRRKIRVDNVACSNPYLDRWTMLLRLLFILRHPLHTSERSPEVPWRYWWACCEKRCEDDLGLAEKRPWKRTRGFRGRSSGRRRVVFRDCVRSMSGVPRKRLYPYLVNEQEENVAGRRGSFLEVRDREKERITPDGTS